MGSLGTLRGETLFKKDPYKVTKDKVDKVRPYSIMVSVLLSISIPLALAFWFVLSVLKGRPDFFCAGSPVHLPQTK